MRDHALKTVGPERAALAAFVPRRREHEMLHDELTAALEQIAEMLLALDAVEHIVLVDLDPGEFAPRLAQGIASAGQFLFPRHQRLPGFDPFFTRDDRMRLHG